MAIDEVLAGRVRGALAGSGTLDEVKMFGGLCFMLNGNMLAVTSQRGMLVRVGKDAMAAALAQANARPIEMSGRPMGGYVFVDPPPADDPGLREWLALAVAFVRTLPAKPAKSAPGARRRG